VSWALVSEFGSGFTESSHSSVFTKIEFELRRCVYPGRFAIESAHLRDWIVEGEA